MSDKLMDTAPGGETPQYESIQTETNPTPKQGGQMGSPSTETPSSMETTANMASDSDSGSGGKDKVEEKVAQGGAGGRTSSSSGSGNQGHGAGAQNESGFAGTTADKSRNPEGYGGEQDMDKTIGA